MAHAESRKRPAKGDCKKGPSQEGERPVQGPAGPSSGQDKVIDYEDSEHQAEQVARALRAENRVVLSGLDLELGGEHHKALYDVMIPSFVNRYTKQWGAKVEDFPFTAAPTDYRKPLDWQSEEAGYYTARMNGLQVASVNTRRVGGRTAMEAHDHDR